MALFAYGLVAFAFICHRLKRQKQSITRKGEEREPKKLVFYDRLSSNNSARIRIWLNFRKQQQKLRGSSSIFASHCNIEIRPTVHAEQRTPGFARVNPFQKVPALIALDAKGDRLWWLAESMVSFMLFILLYLYTTSTTFKFCK